MANAHLTLGEIAEEHNDMVKDVLRASRRHLFDSRQEAERFRETCQRVALARYNVEAGVPREELERRLEAQKIQIFDYEDGFPGRYIYADDELIAYISIPVPYKSSVVFHKIQYMVRTNIQC